VGAAEALESIRPLLSHAALLKFSAEEADWDRRQPGSGRDQRRPTQKPAVIVTDGANGLAWWLGGQAGSMAAFKLEVVDTTGAGDAFLAGLLHRLWPGSKPAHCCRKHHRQSRWGAAGHALRECLRGPGLRGVRRRSSPSPARQR